MALDQLDKQLLLLPDALLLLHELFLRLVKHFLRDRRLTLTIPHLLLVLEAFPLVGSFFRVIEAVVVRNVLIVVIVDNVVLVLPDDVHRTEDVQGVVDTPLHVFEIHLLPDLKG